MQIARNRRFGQKEGKKKGHKMKKKILKKIRLAPKTEIK